MSDDSKRVLSMLSEIRRQLFPDGRGEAFLYGSRARGTAKKHSDWDVLVVTDDSLHSSDPFLSFAFPFAELGWKIGQQITPVHYTRSQWATFESTPFYQNVIREAILL